MNYYVWFFPFLMGYIIGSIIIGKNLRELIKIKNKYLYWGFIMALPIASFVTHSIFLAVLIHALVFFIIKDILVLIFKDKLKVFRKIYAKGLLVILLALGLSIYGYYNAYDIRVKEYTIATIKPLQKDTTIVFVSDLHIGTINIDYELNYLVEEVNKIKPDIVIIGGDLFDEYTSKSEKEKTIHKINELEQDVYLIEGNHDMFTEDDKEMFEGSHIRLLEDESVLIDNNYYLVGRLDKRRRTRKTYQELTKDLDRNKPVIVLEHEPYINDLKKETIDLQLTGHTHNGQLFPGNLFLKYGRYNYHNSKMIVSSGLGVWNIPVRTAGHSEIVKINLVSA